MIQLKDPDECRVVLFAHGNQSINAQQFYADMIEGLIIETRKNLIPDRLGQLVDPAAIFSALWATPSISPEKILA